MKVRCRHFFTVYYPCNSMNREGICGLDGKMCGFMVIKDGV